MVRHDEMPLKLWYCETTRDWYDTELICCAFMADTNCGWR